MITLNSGLFAVYFALLEFLGIKDVPSAETQIAIPYIPLPPILFILSLIAFVSALIPWFTKLPLNFPEEIADLRDKAILVKYSGAITGLGFLVAALFITIFIFLEILRT